MTHPRRAESAAEGRTAAKAETDMMVADIVVVASYVVDGLGEPEGFL